MAEPALLVLELGGAAFVPELRSRLCAVLCGGGGGRRGGGPSTPPPIPLRVRALAGEVLLALMGLSDDIQQNALAGLLLADEQAGEGQGGGQLYEGLMALLAPDAPLGFPSLPAPSPAHAPPAPTGEEAAAARREIGRAHV